MSNIRLFFSATLSSEMIEKLDKSQSHYLTKVMRIKENEVFSLFNKDGEWEAKVLKISKNIVKFKTTKYLKGVNSVPLCEPSQKGCLELIPQVHQK